jgi:hypothetical protein
MPDFLAEVNVQEAFGHADARAGFAWTRAGPRPTDPAVHDGRRRAL